MFIDPTWDYTVVALNMAPNVQNGDASDTKNTPISLAPMLPPTPYSCQDILFAF